MWRRKWFIIFGLIAGTVLGALYFSQQNPVYESSARILVMRESPAMPVLDMQFQMAYQQAALSTQAAIIRSPVIVQRAIEGDVEPVDEDLQKLVESIDEELGKSGDEVDDVEETEVPLRRLDSLASLRDGNPVNTILKSLSAEASRDSNDLMDLSFRSEDPEDCQSILSAVIRSYKAHLKGARDSVTQQTVQLIKRAKGELTNELENRQKEYQKFRSEFGYLIFQDGEGANLHHRRMQESEVARSAITRSRIQLESQLATLHQAFEEGAVDEALLLLAADTDFEREAGFRMQAESLEAKLLPLQVEELRLTQQYGADHPDVLAVRQRIQLTREILKANQDLQGVPEEDPLTREELIRMHLGKLQRQLVMLDLEEKQLDANFITEQDAARDLEKIEVQESTLREAIGRTQRLYDVVIKRLEEVSLADDLGGYDASVISAPTLGYQVEPNLARIMFVSLMLGFMGGFGLAYLSEMSDKTFRSADDIQRCLEAPLVGHIPEFDHKKALKQSKGSALDPTLVAHHRPRSALAESYRGVRTALYFSTRGMGHQVVQVTSPTPGDGKTTLTANLAVAMAQSNRQVLLIDTDFRRSRIHQLFGIERNLGLSSVIRGETQVDDVVQSVGIDNLHVMTAGPVTGNPSELLTSPEFGELIEIVRQKYEFVVIDSPPMLAVTDPSAVAARVDGVLLTLRITKHSRGTTMRSVDLLKSLNVNILGVVVNGVTGSGAGYGANRYYGYGYAYGSGYNYGTYGANGANKYYADDRSDVAAERGSTTRSRR
jgi:capsular exopolysaccharide synthesis family protein